MREQGLKGAEQLTLSVFHAVKSVGGGGGVCGGGGGGGGGGVGGGGFPMLGRFSRPPPIALMIAYISE